MEVTPIFCAAALTAAVKNEIRQLTAEVSELQSSSSSGSESNRQTGKHASTVGSQSANH